MKPAGGTENSGHEQEMRPMKELACLTPVLFVIGAHLFFSAVFTAVLTLIPVFALISVWTYVTILPFGLLALISVVCRLSEIECMKLPSIACTALAPFISWYFRTAAQSNYFAICLLLLIMSIVWLLQSINSFLERVFKTWLSEMQSEMLLSQALRLSYKSVIYFVIAPLCADLVGIIYRAKDADAVLPYIIDNMAAYSPMPLAFLHYGGIVFSLLFESVIAVAMAYKIIRNNDDRTNHSIGLLE